MGSTQPLPDAPLTDRRLAATLTEALRKIGFDAAALGAVQVGGTEHPAGLEARANELPQRLATALRLFVLGQTVTRRVASEALADGLAAGLAIRALVEDGPDVRATLRIIPHDILLLASDLPSRDPPGEHVASAHQPSLTLARLTIRRRVEHALDIGTGNGVQALVLAQHAGRVVATDASERALRFTDFNAALNGRTNIETRRGSWLAPVEGETFGVIVCNPPYVISPGSGLLYRDGDVRGDVLSERLVRDVPSHLDDGGFASILVSWVPGPASDEPVPIGWSADGGCDALVIGLHRESAHDAAAAWNEDDDLGPWLRFYHDAGIAEIAYGAVVLRRRDGAAWREALELPGGPIGHASDHLLRIFAAREVLATGAIHQRRFTVAPDVVVVGTELTFRGGLGLRAQLDAVGAAVVRHLSPTRPAGAAFDAAARDLGQDRRSMRNLGEALVSRLIELGFVLPAA